MMFDERMNAEERMRAALALEPVDRHPVFPILVTAAPRLCGITQAEAWRNHEAARESLIKCYRDYGYDSISKPNYYYPQLPGKFLGAPVRNLIPGKHLAEDDLYQIDEKVLFDREGYDKIAALGWNKFWDEHYPKISRKSMDMLTQMQRYTNHAFMEDMAICKERGVYLQTGVAVDSVLMAFSLCRTLTEFTKDLHEIPDRVEAAMKASCDDLIENAIRTCRLTGLPGTFIVLERGSGALYRLEIFERFEWPFLQRYVDAFVAEGFIPWMHLDTDWGLNLPFFKKLPRGKCVCDLDGTTNIFKAKEILKGHMCISGDVPAAMLSLGKPEEVKAYCKRLIDEVGDGGGFMLTTGCECPIDVKPENLRAMVDTGREYKGKSSQGPVGPSKEIKKDGPLVQLPTGPIAGAIGRLKYREARALVAQSIAEGKDPLEILDECRAGMDAVGELFSRGDYFLSELILSANVFKKAVADLEPLLAQRQSERVFGTVIIGTPKGDIHDIGKDIVATLFRAGGFEVHDLGVDVPPEKFIDKLRETDAKIVAMSALVTPTFESMKHVVDLMKETGLREGRFVIVGGGPTTETVKDYCGADGWTLNPKEGVNMCLDFVKSGAGQK